MKYPDNSEEQKEKLSFQLNQALKNDVEDYRDEKGFNSISETIRYLIKKGMASDISEELTRKIDADIKILEHEIKSDREEEIVLHGQKYDRDRLKNNVKSIFRENYSQEIEELEDWKNRMEKEYTADLESGECPVCGQKKESWAKSSNYLAMHIEGKTAVDEEHSKFMEKEDLEGPEDLREWLKENSLG
jgi:Arc/MetJ-type ribon-helix-helix transcriptional regulator